MNQTTAQRILDEMRERAEDAEQRYRECHKDDRDYPDHLLAVKDARWNAFGGAVAFYQAMCEAEASGSPR